MKLHYYPETGSFYIELRAADSVKAREVARAVNADFDCNGDVVGFDFDQASSKLVLSSLEATALPFATLLLTGT